MIKTLLLTAVGIFIAHAALADTANFYYSDYDSSNLTCSLNKVMASSSVTSVVIADEVTYNGKTYKVTTIAANAVCDLSAVTEITIGKNVTTIGSLTVTDSSVKLGDTNNFSGCPKLATFAVASGSSSFSASGAGILMVKGMNAIARVPQTVATSDGVLKMSTSITGLCAGAFAENTSITELYLSPALAFGDATNSFNDMVNLRRFYVNGSTTPTSFSIKGYVLYNADQTKVISFPPMYQVESYDCGSDVAEIGYKAFANTQLYQVTMPKVKKLGARAFYKAKLYNITLPSTLASIGDEALMACPRLTTITLNTNAALPAWFARASTALTTVNGSGVPESVGTAAFKGCSKFATFPFNGATSFAADSIFVNCAFTEVKFTGTYKPTENGRYKLGIAFLQNNFQLTKVDLSDLQADSATPDAPIDICRAFSDGCPSLKELWLGDATYFSWPQGSSTSVGIFGTNPVLNEFVMGGFRSGASGATIIYDSGAHLPVIYLRNTDTTYKYCELSNFFAVTGSATCQPTVYCEAYSMKDVGPSGGSYVYPGAKYYIPGGADEYAYAKEKAASVEAMYSYTPSKTAAGKFKLVLKSNLSSLLFTKVIVGGVTYAPYPDNGLTVDVDYDKVGEVDVHYTVNGVPMHTIYPSGSSAIGSVTADANVLQTAVSGSAVTFGEDSVYGVIDLVGRTVASGIGAEADLSGLGHGAYVVIAKGVSGRNATVKVVR